MVYCIGIPKNIPARTGRKEKNMKTQVKSQQMVTTALLCAVIVILQVLSTFVAKFALLPISITLALAPILVGTALYGRRTGALLGFVLAVVILIMGITGGDGGTYVLLQANPVATVCIALLKTTVAGYMAGLVYQAIAPRNMTLGVAVAGVVCPVVNTGLFVAGALLFLQDTLKEWAGGSPLWNYIIVGLTGINFLIELAVNLVLATVIVRIIRVYGRRKV